MIGLSCKKSDDCNRTYVPVFIGLKNNPYKDISKISFLSRVNGREYNYYKVDTFTLTQKEEYCNSSCIYGGACPSYYSYTTSYLRYKTTDSKTITVANTYYAPGVYWNFDRYIYQIDSDQIVIPSMNESDYTRNIIIDTLIVNNEIYRFVLKNTIYYYDNKVFYYKPKGEIYFTINNSILRLVDFFTKDTLDVQ
jgi:hypothetical protein